MPAIVSGEKKVYDSQGDFRVPGAHSLLSEDFWRFDLSHPSRGFHSVTSSASELQITSETASTDATVRCTNKNWGGGTLGRSTPHACIGGERKS